MKRLTFAMLTGLIITLSLSFARLSAFERNLDDLQNDVLRLHIIANSDSDTDQQLKLKVRDRVLKECSYIFENTDTLEKAVEKARENLDLIRDTARKEIIENGFLYDVSCEVTQMDFDKKVYEEFTMPKGFYNALRIKIGKAEGKNWWCVMYPPLCVPAAADEDLSLYLSDEEIDIIKNPQKYEVKFKCVEIYEKIKEKLEEAGVDIRSFKR
ncbi:MAG: stage II sporulation protein R [Oscillospiraceae bacterium]